MAFHVERFMNVLFFSIKLGKDSAGTSLSDILLPPPFAAKPLFSAQK
jgi:hypothetical protein